MKKRGSEITTAGRSLSLRQNQLITCAHLLVQSDERLLQFIFHHKECRLRGSSEELLDEAKALSHGEYFLVQAAIDLWNGQGGTRLSDILDNLDDDHFLNLIRALLHYREIDDERRMQLMEWPC
jgi:hypothetical protein